MIEADETFDIVIVGSGGGSMCAALLMKSVGKEPVILEIVPRGAGPSLARSRHYDIRTPNAALSPAQRRAVTEVCRAIAGNDR